MDERAHSAGTPHAEQPIPSDFTCLKCEYPCGGLRDKMCPECGTEITPLVIAQHLDRSNVVMLLASANQRIAILVLSVIALVALATLIAGGWKVAGVLVIFLCALMLVPLGCGWIIALSFRVPLRSSYIVVCLHCVPWMMSPAAAIPAIGLAIWMLGAVGLGPYALVSAMVGSLAVLIGPWVLVSERIKPMHERFGIGVDSCLPVAAAVQVWSIVAGAVIFVAFTSVFA